MKFASTLQGSQSQKAEKIYLIKNVLHLYFLPSHTVSRAASGTALGINRAAIVTLILARRWLTDGAPNDQSWIDPGAAAGGEAGRTGAVAGVGVAGAARDGAGILDPALGGGSLLTAGVSIGASLWTGLNRVNGGLLGGGG